MDIDHPKDIEEDCKCASDNANVSLLSFVSYLDVKLPIKARIKCKLTTIKARIEESWKAWKIELSVNNESSGMQNKIFIIPNQLI